MRLDRRDYYLILILTSCYLYYTPYFFPQRNKANRPMATAAAIPPTINIVLLTPNGVGVDAGVLVGVGVGVVPGKTNVSGIAIVKLPAPLGSSKVKLRLSTPLYVPGEHMFD